MSFRCLFGRTPEPHEWIDSNIIENLHSRALLRLAFNEHFEVKKLYLFLELSNKSVQNGDYLVKG
jgi:hypothetical protein